MHALIKKFGTLSSISTGSSHQIKLPLQGAYSNLFILCKNSSGAAVTYASEIAGIELIAGQTTLIPKMSAVELVTLNKYFNESRGAAVGTTGDSLGVIPLDLTPPNAWDEIQEASYLIGTNQANGGPSSLEVHITFGTLSGVASVEVWGLHYTGIQNGINYDLLGMGKHCRWSVGTQTAYGTGEIEFDGFSYVGSRGVGLLAIVTGTAGSGAADRIRTAVGESMQADFVPVTVAAAAQRMAGRIPQAGYYVTDFCLGNSPLSFADISNVRRIVQTPNWTTTNGASSRVFALTVHGML